MPDLSQQTANALPATPHAVSYDPNPDKATCRAQKHNNSVAHPNTSAPANDKQFAPLALKKAAPRWQVTGVDISQEALEVAKENALRNRVSVNWLQLDILSGIADNLLPISDVIISNPPYICDSERKDMAARVLDYEPHSALFVPDSDPLLFYRRIATLVNLSATRGGDPQTQPIYLFFEINEAYGDAVCDMLRGMGYMDVQLKNDIYGKPRMVFGAVAR